MKAPHRSKIVFLLPNSEGCCWSFPVEIESPVIALAVSSFPLSTRVQVKCTNHRVSTYDTQPAGLLLAPMHYAEG